MMGLQGLTGNMIDRLVLVYLNGEIAKISIYRTSICITRILLNLIGGQGNRKGGLEIPKEVLSVVLMVGPLVMGWMAIMEIMM